MLFFVGSIIIYAGFYALIGGVALKAAYRLFFREHSMELGEAFKLMFIAGLFAFGSNVLLVLSGIDIESLDIALPTLVNFVVVTVVLVQWEGLTPGQALGVGAMTSGFFFLLMLGIEMAVVGALD